jgi:RHS repeat-associated protein
MTQKITPESGTWTYYYDTNPAGCSGLNAGSRAGSLVCSLDANGTYTGYSYDALNRLTDVGTSVANSTCKRFRYDNTSGTLGSLPTGVTLANQYGRLVEAETDDCTWPVTLAHQRTDEWFAYDKDGRQTDIWQSTPHSTQYYHSVATFFENGAPQTVQLASPSLYTMTYTLDGEGRWNSLTDATNSKQLVYSTSINPDGQPSAINLVAAGQDNDAYTYDANTGRMTNYTFTVGATPATLSGTLKWNPNGTLAKDTTVDGFNAGGTLTCVSDSTSALGYGYDDLLRLRSFDCGSGKWGQQFSYDDYDNMSKAVLSGRTGTSWNPGYTTSNHCGGCTYDSNGNVTNDSTNTYQWDEYSKMKSSAGSGTPTCGTGGKCITYDAFGRMVETSVNSTWKEYWYPQVGQVQMSGGTTPVFAYFPSPGGGTEVVNANATAYYYMHKDWIGNARIVSNSGRTVTVDQAYTPYGEVFANFGSTSSQYDLFAGITANFNNGVTYDTPNRELSIVGRWLSPDPAGSGWNQYAYPTNPNSFIDPLGLQLIGPVRCSTSGPNTCPGGGIDSGATYPGGDGSIWSSAINGTLIGVPVYGFIPFTGGPNDPSVPNVPGETYLTYEGIVGYDYSGFGSLGPTGNPANNGLDPNSTLGWTWNFTKSFFSGVINGVRQPGQSVGECMSQNVSEMTFGTVDPQKVFDQSLNQVELGSMVAMTVRTNGISLGTQFFQSATGELGLIGTGRVAAVVTGSSLLTGAAVAGAATVGTAIGSAVNCR